MSSVRAVSVDNWSGVPMSETEAIRVCLRNHLFVPYTQLRDVVYEGYVPQPDEEYIWVAALRAGDQIRIEEIVAFFGDPNYTGVRYTVVRAVCAGDMMTVDAGRGRLELVHNFPVVRVRRGAVSEDDAEQSLPMELSDAASQWRHYTTPEAMRAAGLLLANTPEADEYDQVRVFSLRGVIQDRALFCEQLRALCGVHPQALLSTRLDEYLNYLP